MSENEMVVYESKPLTANDIKAQVDLIQDVMRKVMKDHEHYGVIPGCGDKPALLKPGAEKLNMTFRMAPDPETEIIDLGDGHREYRVKCVMRSIQSGAILGAGVGSASTMESKWRFRTGPVEFTGKAVPKEYWDLRKSEPEKALALIGGKGFQTAKNPDTTQWEIVIRGERVEHDNPADYYNTCWKMAKKRALVDAVLTVTAASDIFTQDVEEMIENGVIPGNGEKKPPITEPKKKAPDKPPETPPSEDKPSLIVAVKNIEVKTGMHKDTVGKDGKRIPGKPWTLYIIHAGNEKYNTFSETFSKLAQRSIDDQLNAVITWTQQEKGKKLESITLEEVPEPGENG